MRVFPRRDIIKALRSVKDSSGFKLGFGKKFWDGDWCEEKLELFR